MGFSLSNIFLFDFYRSHASVIFLSPGHYHYHTTKGGFLTAKNRVNRNLMSFSSITNMNSETASILPWAQNRRKGILPFSRRNLEEYLLSALVVYSCSKNVRWKTRSLSFIDHQSNWNVGDACKCIVAIGSFSSDCIYQMTMKSKCYS